MRPSCLSVRPPVRLFRLLAVQMKIPFIPAFLFELKFLLLDDDGGGGCCYTVNLKRIRPSLPRLLISICRCPQCYNTLTTLTLPFRYRFNACNFSLLSLPP